MNAKHTPGPWKAEGPRVFKDKPKGYRLVCTVAHCAAEEDDARMIAAAPEMLVALRQIIALSSATANGEVIIATARAAIAKATGSPD